MEHLIATNPEILEKICFSSENFSEAFKLRLVCKAFADYALIPTMLKGCDSYDWREETKDIDKISQDEFYLKRIAPRVGFLEMETDPYEDDDPNTQLYISPTVYDSNVRQRAVGFDFLMNFHSVGIKSCPYRRAPLLPSDEMVEEIASKNIDFFVDGRQICYLEDEKRFRKNMRRELRKLKRIRIALRTDFESDYLSDSDDDSEN